jgi:DNA (cytosine-5)-methyltransferase 1
VDAQAEAWPTPRSEDSECCGNHPGATDILTGATKLWTTPNGDDVNNLTRDSGQFKSLTRDVNLWTTPQSHDQAGGNPNRVNRANGGGCANLADDVTLWRTPNTRDHHPGGPREDAEQRQISLCDQVLWRTPSAQEPGISADRLTGEQGSRMYDKETGRLAQYGITQQVEMWGTPTSRDHKDGDVTNVDVPTNGLLGREASRFSLPAPETPPPGETSSNDGPGLRRRLNPAFAALLMGLPWWWTNPAPINSAPSAMESFRFRLRWQFESYCAGSDEAVTRILEAAS